MKIDTITVGLIKGGLSNEQAISEQTAKAVLAALNRLKIETKIFDLNKNIFKELSSSKVDVVFIASHGAYGEDGKLQGGLDILGIPYTGSGVQASAIAMDKGMTKDICKLIEVKTPEYILLDAKDNDINLIEPPFVVKPNSSGSSIGISVVFDEQSVELALQTAFAEDDKVLVERYIDGTLLTIGILNGRPLPAVEIVSAEKFYNYKSKYSSSETKYYIPARLPDSILHEAEDMVVRIHNKLGCKGATRSELIVDKNSNIYFIELNTIPGMTDSSLLPKSAAAIGIEYDELVKEILNDGLKS
ncbi:MAG: D-alanine--D-alanine ligase [Nitrospinota bacterium]